MKKIIVDGRVVMAKAFDFIAPPGCVWASLYGSKPFLAKLAA